MSTTTAMMAFAVAEARRRVEARLSHGAGVDVRPGVDLDGVTGSEAGYTVTLTVSGTPVGDINRVLDADAVSVTVAWDDEYAVTNLPTRIADAHGWDVALKFFS